MYLIYKAKKVKNLLKLKKFKPSVFGCLPSSTLMMGNSAKHLVETFFNFTIFNFFSLVYKIHFIERTLWISLQCQHIRLRLKGFFIFYVGIGLK